MEIYRGDIFYVYRNAYDVTGSEQDSGRPGVIVSNNIGNEKSEIVQVVYLTSQEKTPMPTHTEVVCKLPSVAICEQVCTVSKKRLGDYIKTCTDDEMRRIDECLRISLALDEPVKEVQIADQTSVDQESYKDLLEARIGRDLYKKLYEDTLERLLKAV